MKKQTDVKPNRLEKIESNVTLLTHKLNANNVEQKSMKVDIEKLTEMVAGIEASMSRFQRSQRSRSNSSSRGPRTCHKCGSEDHFIRDCPILKQEQLNKKELHTAAQV